MAKAGAESAEARLVAGLGPDAVLVDDAISPDYCLDETLKAEPVRPAIVVRPSDTEQVAATVGRGYVAA